MDHDSADNVRVRSAHSLVGIHRDVQEPVRVGIGATGPANVANSKLGNVENLADSIYERFGRQPSGATPIVDVVQAPIVGAGQDGPIASIIDPERSLEEFGLKSSSFYLHDFRQGWVFVDPCQAGVGIIPLLDL